MKEFESHPDDKKKAVRTTIIVNVVLLILLLLPFMAFQVPPPGEDGILVSFGAPDMGSGNDMPDTQQEEEVPPQPVEETPPPPEEPEVVEEQTVKEEVITQEDPNAIALKKQQEEEARKKAEAERQQRLEEQRRQEEEARRQEEYAEAKKQFGDLFGEGKGETGTPGNQGDPLGDPSSDNLEGLSTGSGTIGGGLGGRQVRYKPQVVENSQKTGRVVVRVCVDNSGKVTRATVTQEGTTTFDSELVAVARQSAREYRFSESTVSSQCGTITFDFKVQ